MGISRKRVFLSLGAGASSSQKHVDQDSKLDEVQMIQRTFTLDVEKTDKSTFQQIDLSGVL